MWLLLNDKLNDNESILMIGKALLLSQKFESTCKDFIMEMCVIKKIAIEKEFEFFSEEHKNYVDILLNQLLGQSINLYKNNFKNKIPDKEIEILKRAKDARNFICHESAINFIYSSIYNDKPFQWDLDKLKEAITTLAEGDYYISRWSYEFHEEESGCFMDKDIYTQKIFNWIFDSDK